MFIADVLSINAEEKYINEKGAFDIGKCNLMAYANGVTLIEELDEEDLVLDDTVKKIMTTLTF